MRKPLTWLAIAAGLAIGVVMTKNMVAKRAIVGGVKAMTGLTLEVGSMDVGIVKTAIGLRNLRLRNPAGFPDRYLLELPELYVHYDLGAFFKHRMHLEEVRLDLKQVTIVKDREGRLNLDSLKVVQEATASKGSAPRPAAEPTKQKVSTIQIDRFHLKVGKVVYKQYSGAAEPSVQEFAVNLDERYEHITNPQALAALILSRVLMQTTIAKLAGFDVAAIQSGLGTQLRQATRAAAQGAGEAGAEAMSQAVDAVKQTAESLKKAIPFGR